MSYWMIALCVMNVGLMLAVTALLFLKHKNKIEDQRLTKGLQLLQNKISILQELSDKTDEQIRKWIQVLDQKSADIKNHILTSDQKVVQIEEALVKALDVSKIFYDQVPLQEMSDRQKTNKYAHAAKLSSEGLTSEEICQKIDLSLAEVNMITSVNRESSPFAAQALPAWVQPQHMGNTEQNRLQEINDFDQQVKKMSHIMNESAKTNELFENNKIDLSSMNQIRQEFNDSISKNSTLIPQTFLEEQKVTALNLNKVAVVRETVVGGKTVRPFEFRKIAK